MSQINHDQVASPDHGILLNQLLKDHETIIDTLRKKMDVRAKNQGDRGTMDFLSNLVHQHETTVGILSRYLNRGLPAPARQ